MSRVAATTARRRRSSPIGVLAHRRHTKIDVRTLALHGEDDQIVPVKISARNTVRLIKGAPRSWPVRGRVHERLGQQGRDDRRQSEGNEARDQHAMDLSAAANRADAFAAAEWARLIDY